MTYLHRVRCALPVRLGLGLLGQVFASSIGLGQQRLPRPEEAAALPAAVDFGISLGRGSTRHDRDQEALSGTIGRAWVRAIALQHAMLTAGARWDVELTCLST